MWYLAHPVPEDVFYMIADVLHILRFVDRYSILLFYTCACPPASSPLQQL
jgi:hypothetical protein